MDSFEVKKIIIAEIYAFRRKKCELRTGPGALAPPPPPRALLLARVP